LEKYCRKVKFNIPAGLAGMYIVTESLQKPPSSFPYNLGDLEPDQDLQIMIADKLLDENCQLAMNRSGPHKDFFYGDINTLNGR
jgi:hypothetical protein